MMASSHGSLTVATSDPLDVYALDEAGAATGMSIVLLAPEEGKLHWIYGYEYGQQVDLSQISYLPADEGFTGEVVRTREPVLINQHVQELGQKLRSITIGAHPSSWLGLPMIVANKLVGVLSV